MYVDESWLLFFCKIELYIFVLFFCGFFFFCEGKGTISAS